MHFDLHASNCMHFEFQSKYIWKMNDILMYKYLNLSSKGWAITLNDRMEVTLKWMNYYTRKILAFCEELGLVLTPMLATVRNYAQGNTRLHICLREEVLQKDTRKYKKAYVLILTTRVHLALSYTCFFSFVVWWPRLWFKGQNFDPKSSSYSFCSLVWNCYKLSHLNHFTFWFPTAM